jgi:hypothetical protein
MGVGCVEHMAEGAEQLEQRVTCGGMQPLLPLSSAQMSPGGQSAFD